MSKKFFQWVFALNQVTIFPTQRRACTEVLPALLPLFEFCVKVFLIGKLVSSYAVLN